MSLIIEEKEGVIWLANQRLVEYGTSASKRRLEGRDPSSDIQEGLKIYRLLKALDHEDQLSEPELEAILYCLRFLAGEFDALPTQIPPQGQRPVYLLQPPESSDQGGGGGADVDEPYVVMSLSGDLPNARRLRTAPGGILTLTDGGPSGDVTIGTLVNPSKLLGRYDLVAGLAQEITLDGSLSLSAGGVLSATFDAEASQDAVGSILVDSATIAFVYNDAAPSITANVIDSSITNQKIRLAQGLSVIGRSPNTLGTVDDIIAATSGSILRRSGNTLAFGNDGINTLLFNNNEGIDVMVSGGSDVLNIGTSNADVINIGWSGSVVNIFGTRNWISTTDLEVTDKLIRLNKNGPIASGSSSGFEIEENGVATGFFATSGTRNGWDLKAPAIASTATLLMSLLTGNRTYTFPDISGTFMLMNSLSATSPIFYNSTTGVISSQPASLLNEGYVTISTQSFEGLKTFQRTAAVTNAPSSSILFKHKTSADMVDGFGSGFAFAIEDNAGVENTIGRIASLRNGADNTGALVFYNSAAGTLTEHARLTATGLGIGITATAKLHVLGNGIISGNLVVGNAVGAHITNGSAASSYASISRITLGRSSSGFGVIGEGFTTTASANVYNYLDNNFATQIDFTSGNIIFKTAASGTIGAAITFDSRVTILNSNGSVGIGISPSTKLHIESTSTSGSALRFQRGTGVANILQDLNTNNLFIRASDNLLLNDTGGGNVGIGVSGPTSKLHVGGDGLFALNQNAITNVTVTNTDITTTGSRARFFAINGTVQADLTAIGNGVGAAYVGTTSNHTFNIRTNATERITILSSGNVGIGNTNPSEKLEVTGTAKIYDSGVGTQSYLTIGNIASTFTYLIIATTTRNTGSVYMQAGSNAGADGDIKLNGGGGNVGVGVDPLAKFHTSGSLRFDLGSDAVGDIIQRGASGGLMQRLAAVATGNVLISGGVATVSSWGKVGLTTHVSGTLPVANGGTGAVSFTAGQILYGAGTGAIASESNLFWDSGNNRLGINVTPTRTLHVVGESFLNGVAGINAQNSGFAALTVSGGIESIPGSISAFKTVFQGGFYTSSSGGTYPFVDTDNLVFQAYTDTVQARDMVFATGVTPTLRMAISRTGVFTINLGSDATGDIYFRNSSGNFSKLAGVATGNALISGGVSTAPSWGKIGLTTHVSGVLDEVNGGTGQSVYAVGDILYASTTTTLAKLADVATGNSLISGGVGVAPSWGKIGLTTHISGRLAFANLAQGSALSVLGVAGNATADFASIAASLDGQVMRRSGTAIAFGAVDLSSANSITGNLPVARLNNGTSASATTFWRGDGTWATPPGVPGGAVNELQKNNGSGGFAGIGITSSIPGKLDYTSLVFQGNNGVGITTLNATNSAIYDSFTVQHQTTGTPANNIGAAIRYTIDTSAGDTVGAKLSAIATQVGSGVQNFDWFVSLMDIGAAVAERFRVKATGDNVMTFRTASGLHTLTHDPTGMIFGTNGLGSTVFSIRTSAGGSSSANGQNIELSTGNGFTNGRGGHIYFLTGFGAGTGHSGNIGFFNSPDGVSGNGQNVLFIANAIAAPTGVASGGGVLYVEGGALKYRGTVSAPTTIAPA
jgi:hypothetical protein